MNNFILKLKSGVGFTLVELLIVIAVIGIMVTGAIIVINPLVQLQKTQDSKRKSDLSQIQKAFETFYQDNGKYPDSIDNKIKSLSDGSAVEWGGAWLPYMGVLPKDPGSPAKNYVYYSTANGQTYYIYATLDREENDPQICQGLNANGECSSVPGTSLCGGKCNYGVSSPNVSP